ncbi:MAG: nucleotide pyrophosphohydrolase [Candidatus Brocadiae bacterium]|nr:nucleotide pyrophosphohydrolase [Candidatus Brocadiia bacterium]
MKISEFQNWIEQIYGEKDRKRGLDKTFVWFIEEVGELARALHRNKPQELSEEFADCFAWLVTLANLSGINLEEAVRKYQKCCYKCGHVPCQCVEKNSQIG